MTALSRCLQLPDSLGFAQGAAIGNLADREALRRIQTPQAFDYRAILDAHQAWQGAADAPDDAQVARAAGIVVAMVAGDEAMNKLTYAADFAPGHPAVRTGSGFDVHRLVAGEALWLCGVRIAHSHGLSGHSDADVAIHALVDAMLGAIGAGDIGDHFPPSDPQWRGAASATFLRHAAETGGGSGLWHRQRRCDDHLRGAQNRPYIGKRCACNWQRCWALTSPW